LFCFTHKNRTATLRSGILSLAGETCTVYGTFSNTCCKITNFIFISSLEKEKSNKNTFMTM